MNEYEEVRAAMSEAVGWARAIRDMADLARLSEHLPANEDFDKAVNKATSLAMEDFVAAVDRWDRIVADIIEGA